MERSMMEHELHMPNLMNVTITVYTVRRIVKG